MADPDGVAGEWFSLHPTGLRPEPQLDLEMRADGKSQRKRGAISRLVARRNSIASVLHAA